MIDSGDCSPGETRAAARLSLWKPQLHRRGESVARRAGRGRAVAFAAAAVAALAALTPAPAPGQAVTTWNGGTGNWGNSAKWTPAAVPNSSSADVRIDNNTAVPSTVTLDGGYTVGRLTLDSGDALSFANSTGLTVTPGAFKGAGSVVNSGTITLNSTGGLTRMFLGGDVSLSGTGTVDLGAPVGSESLVDLLGSNGPERLTVAAGQTIAGLGYLGAGQMQMTNSGTINANVAGSTLLLSPKGALTGGGTGDFTNSATGVWEATNGGFLQLQGGGGTFANNNVIQAVGTGSVVYFTSGANITGGTLTTSSGGTIENASGNTTLSGVTNNGTFKVDNGSAIALSGTFTNSGTVTATTTSGAVTSVYLSGNVTLAGTGTLNLAAASAGVQDSVQITGSSGLGTERLTVAAGATIAGQGRVGNGGMSLTNNGTLNANVTGGNLQLAPKGTITGGGTGDFTNAATGIWQATNGGFLQLQGGGGSFVNNNTIQAVGTGSVVYFTNGANLTGGTLATSTGGTIENASGVTLTNVTNGGTFKSDNGTSTTLSGTFTNNGTLTVTTTTGATTGAYLSGSVTLAGAGTLNLAAASAGIQDSVQITGASGNGTERLTVGQSATIAGQGRVGNGHMLLTNNGTLNANVSGGTLTLTPASGGDFTNTSTGTWEATNGGTLVLDGSAGGTFSSSGTLNAGNNSEVRLSTNPSISGTLTTTGTGFIHNTSGATFNNVTNNGTVNADNGTVTTLSGTFTNNGTVTLTTTTGAGTSVSLSGSVTLAGTGTLNLAAANTGIQDSVQITGASGNGTERLTVGQNATIAGQGRLGNGQMSMTNNGTVNSNVAGGALALQPRGALTGGGTGDFTNTATGLWEASGGGTLRFLTGGGTFTNNGTIQANDNSTVTFDPTATLTNFASSTLTGGSYKAVSTSNATTLTLPTGNVTTNAANVVLSGTGASIPAINALATNTAAGQFHVLGGKSFTTAGALSNAGTVEVGAVSTLTIGNNAAYTQTGGTTLLDGSLSIASAAAHVAGGVFQGTGTLTGNLSNESGGTIAPGDSPGVLHVTGTYSQAAGSTLSIEIAGPAQGSQYDLLAATGSASLGGTLQVTLLNSYSPPLFSSYQILTAGSRSGTFATTNLPAFPDFRQWQVNYGTNNVTLSVIPEPSTVALFASAACGLLLRRGRRPRRPPC